MQEIAKLRSAGKWLRYVGAKGCYMWIHSLTREVTALRPPDYIDEEVPCEAQEEEDIAGKIWAGMEEPSECHRLQRRNP